MALRLYNSLTKQEEDVRLASDPLTMYTCGPTVYGRPHIGNYASFLMADLLRRWLTVRGARVVHVKNITDVGHLVKDADTGEDKIERQAREEHGSVTHESVIAIARKYETEYLEDERTLNMVEPEHRPRATAYIKEMVAMVEQLLRSGHAYVTDDGIYFDVTSSTPTPYGTLSGNTLDHIASGARVEVREGKRHPADFALWKFCVGDNAQHALRWPSPVGTAGESYSQGFPGWHIECSAMSRALLGDTIDIHTGGEDNIFPHHECEIAQSECVTGKKPFVRLWLHKRRIDLEGEKMSKSLGNVLRITDITQKGYDAMDLRYYLLSVHYRTNLKFSWKGMDDARTARRAIMEWMERDGAGESVAAVQPPVAGDVELFHAKFVAAMDADLNTSGALAAIFECMHYMNTHAVPTPSVTAVLQSFIATVRSTFGCFDPQSQRPLSPQVQSLLDARAAARAAKDFARSDALRLELHGLGFDVKDTADGQKVRPL